MVNQDCWVELNLACCTPYSKKKVEYLLKLEFLVEFDILCFGKVAYLLKLDLLSGTLLLWETEFLAQAGSPIWIYNYRKKRKCWLRLDFLYGALL